MRLVTLTVSGTPTGKAWTWAYPKGQKLGIFEMPTYELLVTGTDDEGNPVKEPFRVFRFGIQCTDGKSARVVGLAEQQTHVIKEWIPTYKVHSAQSKENGAWQVYGNFLIHDGPDNDWELFASIGCIEVFGASGFVKFNDLILSLAGSTRSTRNEQLKEIGNSKKMIITYQKAPRPPLPTPRSSR